MAYKKGREFEKETAELAGKYGRRIMKSGAVGTMFGIDRLSGDVHWNLPWFSKVLAGECKHGYGKPNEKADAKSMTIKKEWFEKHMTQARALGLYPFFSMKFKFTQENGMSKFILIPHSTMKQLLNEMECMWQELQELRERDEQKASKQ
jgi:hypothetical protein